MPEGCKTTHDKGEVMKLKISKLLLESASIFQARNDVRYYLNGICFMPDGRIASTDGHRAFIGDSHDNKLTGNVIIKIGKFQQNAMTTPSLIQIRKLQRIIMKLE